jgi:hypothetical protein
MRGEGEDLVPAGDGVVPRPRPAEPPHGAGPEHVRLRGPPDRDRPVRARLARRRPQLRLHAGAGRAIVIGRVVALLGPGRRVLPNKGLPSKCREEQSSWVCW